MNVLEFTAIMAFLIAGAAGDNSYGFAVLLVILSGICLVLSDVLQKRKKAKKCIRR